MTVEILRHRRGDVEGVAFDLGKVLLGLAHVGQEISAGDPPLALVGVAQLVPLGGRATLELRAQVAVEALVEVLAAHPVAALVADQLEAVVTGVDEHRGVEGSAAQVIDGDVLAGRRPLARARSS